MASTTDIAALTTQTPTAASKVAHSEPFLVQPKSAHTHTIIFLHGLGSNGKDCGTELLESGISSSGTKLVEFLPSMKFVFPTAKKRRSFTFRRAMINEWFDIASLEDPSFRRDLQLQGLAESGNYLLSILNRELETVPSRNIILGGLSQGCAMALLLLLRLDFPLGGFVGISGWLPFGNDISELTDLKGIGDGDGDADPFTVDEVDQSGKQDPSLLAINFARDILSIDELDVTSTSQQTCLTTPAFLGHGVDDEKIRCNLGEAAARTLSSLGMQSPRKSIRGWATGIKFQMRLMTFSNFLEQSQGWIVQTNFGRVPTSSQNWRKKEITKDEVETMLTKGLKGSSSILRLASLHRLNFPGEDLYPNIVLAGFRK